MKILDRYILRKFLGTFFYAIIIMAVIACVIDYSQKVEDFVKHKAPLLEILNYFKNFMPYMIALLYPLFIFIATIFFTSKLAYKSEIIAILASGTSFQRFMRPYLYGALILGTISLVANHWVVPAANRQRLVFEDRYIHEAKISSRDNVHLRLTPNLYIFLQNYNYKDNSGYRFTAEKINGIQMTEKLFADRISYDSTQQEWKLTGVTIRTNQGLKESLRYEPMLTRKYPFSPKDLDEDDDIMTALTTPRLLQTIEKQRLRGVENLNFYYVELHRRTAQPFAGLILTIIGACIASRKIRGGSGFHLALGIVISAVYIMLLQFSTTFSTKAGLNPFIAVWIPNIIFGFVALYLFRRQTR